MELMELVRVVVVVLGMFIIYITFNKNRDLKLALDNKSEVKEDNEIDKKKIKLAIKINMIIATLGLYFILMIVSYWIGLIK